jgi:phospho-N-acetylmuramoyl-pentapeptide-transferase
VIALLMAASAAFAFNIVVTPFLIRALRGRGIGQLIRDDGPFAHPHAAKAGTPTMGGIAIVAGVVLGYFFAHLRSDELKFARTGLLMIALIIGLATVGFVDDYLGVRRGRNLGLRKRGKTAGQLLVAGVFAYLALEWVGVSTNLSYTRPTLTDLTTVGWFVIAVLIVYGSSNAVNLTDGMDGLAAGSATLVFMAFTIIGFWQFRHPEIYGIDPAMAIDLSVVAAALAGACAGFLWWNAAPAQIFMGDTGSLALGGAMAGLALLGGTVLLLPVLGGLYVVETLSVIAQVISFRGFGRRVLRMAPIHHHFEVGGWPETTVIVRLWLFSGAFVALGLGLFYANFINIPGVIE